MKFHIRELRLPEDYPSIARVLNCHLSEPTSAERLQEEDAKIPAQGRLSKDEAGLLTGFDRLKLAAENESGTVVGYGIAWRAPWNPPGELNHTLIVEPDSRRIGAGSGLYEQLEQWAAQVGASRLNYYVKDNEPLHIRFAENRGYSIERHTFESVLDLRKRDVRRREGGAELLKRQGIRLSTLMDWTGEENERKLYELYRCTTPDIPGNRESMPDFKEWRKWTLQLPGSRPEYVLLASEGERWVGVVHLLYHGETNSFYHEYTGVERANRGKGIATALKLEAIRLAVQSGADYLRTHNDSMNGPMLNINRDKLGFEAVPGRYNMIKKLQN